jgi:formate dehydrogenase subunit delta
MRIERLVAMANDIGAYFATRPAPDAVVEGVADHLKRFWDPRMRRQLAAHVEATGGEGLQAPVVEAVKRLSSRP